MTIDGKRVRFEDTREGEITTMIGIDLTGPILLTRDALPMMRTSSMGKMRELEAPESVAEAIVAGIAGDAIEMVRGDDDAVVKPKLNQSDPATVDAQFARMKPHLAEAAEDHSAL